VVAKKTEGKPTSKAEFLQRLDWSPVEALKLPTEWIGSDLYVTLDDTRRAVVALKTHNCADHYERLVVRVVNKHEGEIDSQSFGFDEHLKDVGRIDTRQHDYPDQSYGVISYVAWDWHLAVPKTTEPLTKAVAAYLALFR